MVTITKSALEGQWQQSLNQLREMEIKGNTIETYYFITTKQKHSYIYITMKLFQNQLSFVIENILIFKGVTCVCTKQENLLFSSLYLK